MTRNLQKNQNAHAGSFDYRNLEIIKNSIFLKMII